MLWLRIHFGNRLPVWRCMPTDPKLNASASLATRSTGDSGESQKMRHVRLAGVVVD
jgi:hypothetical protein